MSEASHISEMYSRVCGGVMGFHSEVAGVAFESSGFEVSGRAELTVSGDNDRAGMKIPLG